jgi:hypothetical protein
MSGDLFIPSLVTETETRAEPSVTETPEHDFDWHGDHVVTQKQPRTAVYRNALGQVVIRQEGDYPDDDVIAVFNEEVVARLILHLADQLEESVWIDIRDALDRNGWA